MGRKKISYHRIPHDGKRHISWVKRAYGVINKLNQLKHLGDCSPFTFIPNDKSDLFEIYSVTDDVEQHLNDALEKFREMKEMYKNDPKAFAQKVKIITPKDFEFTEEADGEGARGYFNLVRKDKQVFARGDNNKKGKKRRKATSNGGEPDQNDDQDHAPSRTRSKSKRNSKKDIPDTEHESAGRKRKSTRSKSKQPEAQGDDNVKQKRKRRKATPAQETEMVPVQEQIVEQQQEVYQMPLEQTLDPDTADVVNDILQDTEFINSLDAELSAFNSTMQMPEANVALPSIEHLITPSSHFEQPQNIPTLQLPPLIQNSTPIMADTVPLQFPKGTNFLPTLTGFTTNTERLTFQTPTLMTRVSPTEFKVDNIQVDFNVTYNTLKMSCDALSNFKFSDQFSTFVGSAPKPTYSQTSYSWEVPVHNAYTANNFSPSSTSFTDFMNDSQMYNSMMSKLMDNSSNCAASVY